MSKKDGAASVVTRHSTFNFEIERHTAKAFILGNWEKAELGWMCRSCDNHFKLMDQPEFCPYCGQNFTHYA